MISLPHTRWVILALVVLIAAACLNFFLLCRYSSLPTLVTEANFDNTEIYLDTDDVEWIHHAQDAAQNGEWRRRWDASDNYPYGRSVHWSSVPLWALMGIGKLISLVSGDSWHRGIELAGRFWTPCLFLLASVIGFPLIARKFGFLTAGISFFGLISQPILFSLFSPLRPDHHGLQALLTFWAITSACAAVRNPQEPARHLIWSSAVACGCLVWIGAFIAAPIIVALVLGLCVAIYNSRPRNPDQWRDFGYVGAATATTAYLIEYFPSFPLRLDINGPFFILGFLIAGEMLRQASDWSEFSSGSKESSGRYGRFRILGALLLLGVLLHLAGPDSFSAGNPICRRQAQTVSEVIICITDADFLTAALLITAVLGAVLIISQKDVRTLRYLAPAASATVLLVIASFFVGRWYLFSILAALVFCALAAPVLLGSSQRALNSLFFLGLGMALVPGWFTTLRESSGASRFGVHPALLSHSQLREAAGAVINDAEDTTPVLLSYPDTSTIANYYIGGKTIGTCYWESTKGMERAFEILACPSTDDAERLIREAGVTHIIIPSNANASAAAAYSFYGPKQLYLSTEFFGDHIQNPEKAPKWLKLVAGSAGTSFLVYRVLPPTEETNEDA